MHDYRILTFQGDFSVKQKIFGVSSYSELAGMPPLLVPITEKETSVPG